MKQQTKTKIKKAAQKTLSATGRALLFLIDLHEDLAFLQRHHGMAINFGLSDAKTLVILAEAEKERRENRVTFHRLKRRGLIEERMRGDHVLSVLTRKGHVEALVARSSIRVERLPLGHVCLVVFDVPEVARKARNEFRSVLKRLGFVWCQRSVWSTQLDHVEAIRSLIKELRIEKWVRVYSAKEK